MVSESEELILARLKFVEVTPEHAFTFGGQAYRLPLIVGGGLKRRLCCSSLGVISFVIPCVLAWMILFSLSARWLKAQAFISVGAQ